MTRKHLSFLLTLGALVIAAAASAQSARVTHAAVVHSSWQSSSAEVGRVTTGTIVKTTSHRGGYTHIQPPKGSAGWIYTRYLEDVSAADTANTPTTTTTPATPEKTTTGVNGLKEISALPKPALAEAHDVACADSGGNSTVRLDAQTNLLKNRIHDGTYTEVPFQAVLALPWQGMHTKRYLWSQDDLKRTRDYEGAAISVTGYLVAVEPKTGEATNCEKSTDDWVDWHIWLVETQAEAVNKDKTQAIVVETTPRVRKEFPSRFDIAQLRGWIAAHQKVTVSGWLMLDPDHPTDATGTAKKHASRGTIWEIHPVMKIELAK